MHFILTVRRKWRIGYFDRQAETKLEARLIRINMSNRRGSAILAPADGPMRELTPAFLHRWPVRRA